MNAVLLAACIATAVSLSAGQLMFKLAAEDVKARLAISWQSAATSGWLISALVLYALATALWLWVLSQMPLSRAYPFVLAGAALVPLMAFLFLREPLSPTYIIGFVLVAAGLALIQLTG
jgi:multidrug transporter EmrE-like cation transporter